MTTAATTDDWTFRGPSDRYTARIRHSADCSHRATQVRGATQVKGRFPKLRTGATDPKQTSELLTPELIRAAKRRRLE